MRNPASDRVMFLLIFFLLVKKVMESYHCPRRHSWELHFMTNKYPNGVIITFQVGVLLTTDIFLRAFPIGVYHGILETNLLAIHAEEHSGTTLAACQYLFPESFGIKNGGCNRYSSRELYRTLFLERRPSVVIDSGNAWARATYSGLLQVSRNLNDWK